MSIKLTFSTTSSLFDGLKLVKLFLRKSPLSVYNSIIQGARMPNVIHRPKGFPERWTYNTFKSLMGTVLVGKEVFTMPQVFTRGVSEMPIPDSEVCKFVGYLPFKHGSMPNKVVYSDHAADKYLEKQLAKGVLDTSSIFSDKAMISGGAGVIMPNLRAMATPSASKFSYTEMLEAVCARQHLIDLPTLPLPKESWFDAIKVNVSAFTGFFTSLFYGSRRGDSFEMSKHVALKMYQRIINNKVYPLELWTFGSRPKLADLSENGKPIRTRPIAMCDDILTRICSVISQPLTEAIIRSPLCELFIGRGLGYDEVKWLNNYLKTPGTLIASPDWSQYDNHIYEEVLVVAFSIIRQCLPKGKQMDDLLYYICASVVDKFIVLDPGLIFKLMKGLPSGHPFTSLVNTISNWVIWSTIFVNYSKLSNTPLDDSKFRLVCSGDDTVLMMPDDVNFSILKDCIARSGMKLDDIESSVGLFNSTDSLNGAVFLRRRFSESNMLFWDYNYLIEKLRFNEDVNNPSKAFDRACDYLRTGPGYAHSTELLVNYIKENLNLASDITLPMVGEANASAVDYFWDVYLRDYLMDAAHGLIPKEGWAIKRSSKMKIPISGPPLQDHYFSKGISRISKKMWSPLPNDFIIRQARKGELNISTRFRPLSEL